MKRIAYLFPGQGSQHMGMGHQLYIDSPKARKLFHQANEILGFELHEVMFHGSPEELAKTSVTQPAIYTHSVILANVLSIHEKAAMCAGHSLGEFSALAASSVFSFEDGLRLVQARANAMQTACDAQKSSMAAIIGMEAEKIESILSEIDDVVVPANYNSPVQTVISGSENGVSLAIEKLKENGAKRCIVLNVNGAFHSPLMESARLELATAIEATEFNQPICPVYQNITAKGETDKDIIKSNLIAQLTGPVKWNQSIQQMIQDGAEEFVEIGPEKVLNGLMRKIDRTKTITSIDTISKDTIS